MAHYHLYPVPHDFATTLSRSCTSQHHFGFPIQGMLFGKVENPDHWLETIFFLVYGSKFIFRQPDEICFV